MAARAALPTPACDARRLRRWFAGRRHPGEHAQAVPDGAARALLVRAFHAARAVARADGACRRCYPADASEITEDMNARTGDQYAAAATPFGARLPGVVYVDTTGPGRLSRTRITLYARTSNGTIWQLEAGRGRRASAAPNEP